MQLAQIMDVYRTGQDLRDYASTLKRGGMAQWIESTNNPDRKNRAQVLRGEILEIVATVIDRATELERIAIGGDVDLQLLLRELVKTSRGHLGVELTALQGILDLLDRMEQLVIENGIDEAHANALIALADRLVADSRAAVAFHTPSTAVTRTLDSIRATLKEPVFPPS